MVIVTHPTGNANVRNVIGALRDENLLDSYQTTFACHASGAWRALSRLPGLGEFRRRQYDESLRGYIKTAPIRELCRLASQRLGLRSLLESETGVFSIDRIYQSVDEITARRLQSSSAAACYAYEDGALRTFKAAKRWGKLCLYDLPIGYWRAARQILLDEAKRRPEWAATLEGLKDSEGKLARKDEELRLADRVIVASTFTKHTLEQCPFPVGPISIAPYGADDAFVESAKRPFRKSGGSLRALFVGGLSQRKGIADLFDAADLIGQHLEVTIVGRKPSKVCAPLEAYLSKHRWIESLPREKILELMRAHDVLVFPSLFEGFGLVVTEALSQGLPVITTSHTCGPDVLTEGEDGFIVPIRNPQAIAEKLDVLLRDHDRLAGMSDAARRKAETLTWEAYRRSVADVVRETLAAA